MLDEDVAHRISSGVEVLGDDGQWLLLTNQAVDCGPREPGQGRRREASGRRPVSAEAAR